MRTLAVAFILVSAACAGEQGPAGPCDPSGAMRLQLEYLSGDCLPEGWTEEITFDIRQQGETFIAYERGQLVDSVSWSAEYCRLTIVNSFYFEETADTWEIEGTVEYDIDVSETPPQGFGEMNATIYPAGGVDECSHLISINP